MPIRIYRHVPEPGIIRYDAGDTGVATRWNCVVPKGRNGAPRYVRVGEGGAISTSETGESGSWTSQTNDVSVMLNFVIYDSYTSKYWAVGASGTMLSSSDGITWSAVSLPVEVASDSLTGIATNGAGNFAVSNGTTGERGLVSTDSGVTFVVRDLGGGPNESFTMGFDGTYFVAPRNGVSGSFVSYVLASNPNSTWAVGSSFAFGSTTFSFVVSGSNRVMAGGGGQIFTCPLSSTPTASNWTARTSGASESLRLFIANGSLYAVGGNGASRMSTDNGETWQSGPPVGVTSFLRYGVTDASDPTRAIVVGDAGVTLFGQYGLRVKGYATAEDRPSNPIAQSPKFAFADQPVTGLTVDLI